MGKQASFDFDQRSIDTAVARIKTAADYVGNLRGFVPGDPLAAHALQKHVGELRDALDVLRRLADTLDHAQARQRGK